MNEDTTRGCASPRGPEDNTAIPDPQATASAEPDALRSHRAAICHRLLRSRLQHLSEMEEKLEKMSKYSLKILNAHDELAMLISREKRETTRIATAAGVPIRSAGYIMSYTIALEESCNALLDES